MMIAVLKGALVALSLTLGFGPGLIVQFEASINRGFRAGASVISGLYASDVFLVSICYLGFTRFLQQQEYKLAMGIIGGLIIIIFGFSLLIKRVTFNLPTKARTITTRSTHLVQYFMKGFMINVTNPFAIVFWLGILSIAGTNFGIYTSSFYVFFIALFVIAICCDLLKVFCFSKVKRFFTPVIVTWINRTMGSILVIIGIVIITKVL
jgi:threonine/homoserine/homoserine lactone efflux protein